MRTIETKSLVKVNKKGWHIAGQPEVILCASLFYFRIPMAQWDKRLQQVKDAGYNAIDVYFPWNYHEQERGEWDFSGEKDLTLFLEMAKEKGLWVIARPGPYICSEWDGGALPAYLLPMEGIRLRDNDPIFLSEVSRWFAQIMPVLREYELGREGSIIAVQLDNELDFYNCIDPHGYISALRDMAIQYEVNVPLFACAGQGNLYRATGNVEDVMPTCNFYPNDLEIDFEDRVVMYYKALLERNYPLSVTETNRSHFLLRRLLGSGVKLLGPYLQVSGTNFGFNNAINNWGDPLALLTSDYDFTGMIAPSGEERKEYYEGRLLSRMLRALGPSIASSEPIPSFIRVNTNIQETAGMRYLLKLDGGGYLISLPNVGKGTGKVSLETEQLKFPIYTELLVSAANCPILPYAIPLTQWDLEGELAYATAELFEARKTKEGALLVFNSANHAEVSFVLPKGVIVNSSGAEVHWNGKLLVLTTETLPSNIDIHYPNGARLQVVIIERDLAKHVRSVLDNGEFEYYDKAKLLYEQEFFSEMKWSISPSFKGSGLDQEALALPGSGELYAEKLGVNRGFMWYENHLPTTVNEVSVQGILLQNASDILSVYANDSYEATVVPGGSSVYVPFTALKDKIESVVIRAEIWGHTNFDDIVMPALRQSSMKGLKGALAVTKYSNWSHNWRFRPCGRLGEGTVLPEESLISADYGIIDWGNWIFTGGMETGLYSKLLTPSGESGSSIIAYFKDIRIRTAVFVDKQFAGVVNQADPYFDLTSYMTPGHPVEITLYLERANREDAGSLFLIEGTQITDWKVHSAQEQQLWDSSKNSLSISNKLEWPLKLSPGEVVWLHNEWKEETGCANRTMQVMGNNAKLTAFYNGRIVGRMWLPCTGNRPTMSGGSQVNIYLPGSWLMDKMNRISFLVEAIQVGSDAVITSVQFERGYFEGEKI